MQKQFSQKDISDYYDLTKVHYRRGWDLDNSKALHYGYWDDSVKDFSDSLEKMNEKLSSFGVIDKTHKVLDAGCGIGGSAIYLASTIGCHITGISINEEQIKSARLLSKEYKKEDLLLFYCRNYLHTGFADESFDIVWAMESVIHAPDKKEFLEEAFRILKKGGRLIMCDYFSNSQTTDEEHKYLMKWLNPWAISDIISVDSFVGYGEETGFENTIVKDVTSHIEKASSRMYYGSFYLGFITFLYKIINPRVSRFSKNHYKAMYYQYRALRKGLWEYWFVSLTKN